MQTILSDIPLTITSQKHSLHVFDPVVLQNGKPCVGCFSCWLKTPGTCIYQDAITDFTRIMKESETLYILTHNQYGSYSPLVKCAIDRSLSYVQPYFTIRNHEMHHVLFPNRRLQLIVIAYGPASAQEQTDLSALAQANGINMGCRDIQCYHCMNEQEALTLLRTMEEGIQV